MNAQEKVQALLAKAEELLVKLEKSEELTEAEVASIDTFIAKEEAEEVVEVEEVVAAVIAEEVVEAAEEVVEEITEVLAEKSEEPKWSIDFNSPAEPKITW